MTFSELSVARYSMRKFSPQAVEAEKLNLVLQAGQNAPTAHNDQPQRIFVFQSPEALAKARACTPCHFEAPVLMAIGADPTSAWVRDNDKKNYGEVDASIVVTQMMLQATDLGLGTTWVGVFDQEALRAAFPELCGIELVALLPLGYPREDAKPARLHTMRKPLEELVTYL